MVLEVVLPVPVLVVEDEEIIQLRLRKILIDLGYTDDVLLFAKNVKEAFALIEEQPISLALVDLGLPDGNGLEIIEKISLLESNTLILVISAWSTQESLFAAIKAGATGYVLKERDDAEVLLSIRSILRGGAPIDPFIAQKILKQLQFNENNLTTTVEKNTLTLENGAMLSKRELEILELVSQGLSNKEIANSLNLSRYTVESHIKHIYRKLAVRNRSKAVDTARNLGLLD